jgi:hypothetical protein
MGLCETRPNCRLQAAPAAGLLDAYYFGGLFYCPGVRAMAYAATSNDNMVNRMLRAARLEVPLYEEVEADVNATNQALLVVVIVAACSGVAAAIGNAQTNAIAALVGGVLQALIGWAVWSFVIFFVGTRVMGGTATYGELLRTLGFAQSPGVLLLVSFVPVVGGIVALIVGIWSLVAGFIGTRQALDLDNAKTAVAILLGILAFILCAIVVSLIFGAVFGLGMLVGRSV